jgi:hypothetical protein
LVRKVYGTISSDDREATGDPLAEDEVMLIEGERTAVIPCS